VAVTAGTGVSVGGAVVGVAVTPIDVAVGVGVIVGVGVAVGVLVTVAVGVWVGVGVLSQMMLLTVTARPSQARLVDPLIMASRPKRGSKSIVRLGGIIR
jgi:hypothetical protein